MTVICLTKTQLAGLCGVTTKTISVWLNVRYFPELEKLGYQKTQKVLLPRQVEFICGKLDVQPEEFDK
jgi:hypothetical protein